MILCSGDSLRTMCRLVLLQIVVSLITEQTIHVGSAYLAYIHIV